MKYENLNGLLHRAEAGDAEAQYQLGSSYYHNKIGETPNIDEAKRWLYQAAKQGHMKAQYMLGVMYSNFVGVKPDLRKACEYFYKSARQGFQNAKDMLEIYAEQGVAESQCYLGLLYAEGVGVNHDISRAVYLLYKAASQGLKKARDKLRDLAAQKSAEAQYHLGILYSEGKGIDCNKVTAYVLLVASAENGCKEAAEIRDEIAKDLSQEQKNRAYERANNLLEVKR
ncbi:MAG: sel1 repeat family protein [Clostridiales bacterium]|jgi:TPR repeat protein|nr:sel1 repeat family protein [Clostridiales bacterium]